MPLYGSSAGSGLGGIGRNPGVCKAPEPGLCAHTLHIAGLPLGLEWEPLLPGSALVPLSVQSDWQPLPQDAFDSARPTGAVILRQNL